MLTVLYEDVRLDRGGRVIERRGGGGVRRRRLLKFCKCSSSGASLDGPGFCRCGHRMSFDNHSRMFQRGESELRSKLFPFVQFFYIVGVVLLTASAARSIYAVGAG
jgi:hypothetical protein